jgi:predicted transcriptional regulator
MGKTGKQRLPIPENPAYCRILYSLNSEKLIAQDIANKVNIDQSTIIRHLQYLTEADIGFVKVEYVKKTKYYYVDWLRVSKEFIDFLIEKAKEYEAYLIDWSKSSVTATGLGGQAIIKQLNNGNMPFQQLFKQDVVKRLSNNPFLQDFFKRVLTDFDRQGKNKNSIFEITIKDLFEYMLKRVIVDSDFVLFSKVNSVISDQISRDIDNNKALTKKEKEKFKELYFSSLNQNFGTRNKKDVDAILYNCLDNFGYLQRELLTNREDYKGYIEYMKHKNMKEPEIQEFLKELKECELNNIEKQYLRDYVVLLPFIFDDINKKREIETSFIVSNPKIEKLEKRSKLLKSIREKK